MQIIRVANTWINRLSGGRLLCIKMGDGNQKGKTDEDRCSEIADDNHGLALKEG